MEKQSFFWTILKQLFLILWKLFLMIVLIAGRIVVMIFSIMNSKIEDYLRVPKKNL